MDRGTSSTLTNKLFCLSCIIINKQRKMFNKFLLMVPRGESCEIIIAYLRIVAPSLRKMDQAMFRIYKPRPTISLKDTQLAESNVNLEVFVNTSAPLQTELLAGLENPYIHAIIHICAEGMSSRPTHWPILRLFHSPTSTSTACVTSKEWPYFPRHDKFESGRRYPFAW